MTSPELRLVLESVRRFRAGELDIGGLQANISAVMGVLSPTPVREAVYQAEAAIDSIRFTVDRARQRGAVELALNDPEESLARHEEDS
jgi:hypothetical protein